MATDRSLARRIAVDAELCRDCQACTLACSLYHEGECNLSLARIVVSKDMARYKFTILVCRQCNTLDCLEACPAGAIVKDKRGVAAIVDEDCLRCGACAEACPHQALFYDALTDRYLKCDLCTGRAEGPLCVEVCPVGALTLGAEFAGAR